MKFLTGDNGKSKPTEPKVELLSLEDVDKDVASLSEALREKQSERIVLSQMLCELGARTCRGVLNH
jgi:hypothetical protein